MTKTILLVTHEETVATDYGYMAGYLEELGHTVIHHSVLDATPGHDGFLPANVDFPSLDGIDSVIIFGSFTHAYDERTRAWVESVALRAAIAAGDRRWEAEILAAIHRLEGCSPQAGESLGDDWFRENRFFHDALTSACNSAHIMAYRASLYDLSDRYRRLSAQVQTSDRNLDAEHRQIMDAVLAKDADAAIACIEDHFVETVQAILNNELSSAADVERTIANLRKDIRNGCART
jgi:hypothetical protein